MATQSDSLDQISAMKKVLAGGIIIMIIKVAAYFISHSNAVLTDALESIINIVAGVFAIFSLHFAMQPKDENHPYGHGKIELLSAGFEGGLILISGILIIMKSIYGFFHPHLLKGLTLAAFLSFITGAANYIMGKYLINLGKKYQSIIMVADGKHLISDTVTSIGLLLGLLLIYFTNINWIDNVMAILFGALIIYTGFKLVKQSVTGLLDEADYEKLENVIQVLNENRNEKWIDIHNLRVLKYGNTLHIDAHITLPWYDNLEESHEEVSAVEQLLKAKIHDKMEFFIHSDPCIESSCPICPLSNCAYRKAIFQTKLNWTLNNLLPDKKHTIET